MTDNLGKTPVHKVALIVDDAWLDAVQRMLSYLGDGEFARIESVEPAGTADQHFSAEFLQEMLDAYGD